MEIEEEESKKEKPKAKEKDSNKKIKLFNSYISSFKNKISTLINCF